MRFTSVILPIPRPVSKKMTTSAFVFNIREHSNLVKGKKRKGFLIIEICLILKKEPGRSYKTFRSVCERIHFRANYNFLVTLTSSGTILKMAVTRLGSITAVLKTPVQKSSSCRRDQNIHYCGSLRNI